MSLLTTPEKEAIRNAIKSVTDTFFVTPVEYHLIGSSIDRFGESTDDIQETVYNLNCLVEWTMDSRSDYNKMQEGGTYVENAINVTIYQRDLPSELINTDFSVKMNAGKDYLVVKGKKYKLQYLGYAGPLDAENVLVTISAKVEEELG